jgi:hypothetical protein
VSSGPHEATPLACVPAAVSGGITLDVLRATFDHWRIFEKNDEWWAMRSGTATSEGPRSLILPLVRASTLEGLADHLSVQEWLRRMPAAELEAVWRNGFPAAGDVP